MLIGYAVECALKGLWLRAGNKLIVNGKFIRVPNTGEHELGQLARVVSEQVHLPLTDEELSVLDRLSAFVLFAGRYPVSLRPEEMKERKTSDGGRQVPTFFSEEDFQVAKRLLNGFTTALSPHFNRFRLANHPDKPRRQEINGSVRRRRGQD
jgi:hypothetical protein